MLSLILALGRLPTSFSIWRKKTLQYGQSFTNSTIGVMELAELTSGSSLSSAPKSSVFRDLCQGLVPRPRTKGRGCCVRLPPEIVRDPDPSTYDQQRELAAGLAPTFNSPDITTVNLWPIRPVGTLQVTVRNLSTDASATGTRVDVSWSQWGIGLPRLPIATAFADLARAGFPGSERRIDIATPSAVVDAERYGIFAKVLHPYDRDLTNNAGEQTIDGFATSETRSKQFVIPVRNPTGAAGNIQLQVSPNMWGASVVPSVLTLAAGAQQNVQFSLTVPAGVPASPPGTLITQSFEIMALMNGVLLGGVTILVLVDA